MILSLAQLFFFDIKSTDYQKKFPCGQKQIQLVNTCHYGRLSSKCLYIHTDEFTKIHSKHTHTQEDRLSVVSSLLSHQREEEGHHVGHIH